MLFVEAPGLFFSLPPGTLQVSYGITCGGHSPNVGPVLDITLSETLDVWASPSLVRAVPYL
jgi:hypothetical protein